jgi:hypothetical protein
MKVSFQATHYFIRAPNVTLSTPFSDVLSVCSINGKDDRVPHPYKATMKINPRDSSIGTVTCYGLEGRRGDSRQGQEIVLVTTRSRTALGTFP